MAPVVMTWLDPVTRSVPEMDQHGTSSLMGGLLDDHRSRGGQGVSLSRARGGGKCRNLEKIHLDMCVGVRDSDNISLAQKSSNHWSISLRVPSDFSLPIKMN
ncbi:hypothetical protein V6N12_055313 [Hibiscus sabdariffa]|uniref:Uncharacterized protein n=1 Tax=Hibiscus sabdariffa TaxID=183260 RepID=A0ABR2BTN1_9ROSI